MKREYYKVSELAYMLGMNRISIIRRIEDGRLKAIKNDGRNGHYLIPVEEYNNYIKSLGV